MNSQFSSLSKSLFIGFPVCLILIFLFQNCGAPFQSVADLASLQNSEAEGENGPDLPPSREDSQPEEEDPPPDTDLGGGTTPPSPPQPIPGYETSPFSSPFAIVYVRVPRVTQTADYVDSSGITHPSLRNWDMFQALPETSHRLQKMSGPGQLVYRSRTGEEKILFDCITLGDCLPMDPTMSFDGKRVIFSVLKGTFKNPTSRGVMRPYNELVSPKEARLHIADISSGQITALPHTPGTFDTGPAFLPDGNIVFTSTRSQEFRSSHFYYTPESEKALQFWISREDGSNAHRVGPHDRDGVLHPFVMTDGRVLFSTWQTMHIKAHIGNNGSTGGPSAEDNKFWIASMDHTGGTWEANFGAHGRNYVLNGSMKSTKALHFVGETTNNWLCSTDYYRANNFGAGSIICWHREPLGIEGRGPSETSSLNYIFTPRKILSVATWSSSGDNNATKLNGVYTGKLRDPNALPGNQMLLTYMKGPCSTITGISNLLKHQDEPYACDGGIYYTTRIPSTHPSDLVKVVDRPEWQEFMPRVAEPYSFIYGKAKPDTPKLNRDPAGRCIIASSSMEGEVEPVSSYNFLSAKDCAIQGCKAREIPMSQVKAIRFWQVLPITDWNTRLKKIRSNVGHIHKLLGDVPLNSDGSFAAEIPCDTPYVLAGVDGDGNTILRDQIPQSLRKGEIRTCTGCHLHSRPGRPMEQSLAYQQLSNPFKVGINNFPTMQNNKVVPMTVNVPQIVEFGQHVYPILQNRCASCHSGTSAARGLRLDIPGVSLPGTQDTTSTWYRLAWDYKQLMVPEPRIVSISNPTKVTLEKPYTSIYMNSAFAIESPLLWKLVNRRTDGRTDDQYPNDLDFGPSHPTSITPDEIRIIRDWIDSGAYGALPQ